METAGALRAARAWADPLARAARGAVHSSFDHALNVSVGDELLTVVTAGTPPMPGALVCDAARLPRLAPGTPVRLGRGAVRAGRWTVHVAGAEVVDCRVEPVAEADLARGRAPGAAARAAGAAPGERAAGNDAARLPLEALRDATPGSFVLREAPSPAERVVHRRLHAGADALRRALTRCLAGGDDAGGAHAGGAASQPRSDAHAPAPRAAELTPAVHGLLGLGAGLTPSGDDYLVGALAVLHQTPGAPARAAAAGVAAGLDHLADATTAVGAQYLRAAAGSRFHRDIAAAARAALTRPADVPDAFAAVRRIGSTSGTDTLLGIAHTAAAVLDAVRDPGLEPGLDPGHHPAAPART